MFVKVKDKHESGYAVMMIKDKKEIVVEKAYEKLPDTTPETSEAIFNEMRREILDKGGPRYILFDFSFKRANGSHKDVALYIYW